ncbi:Uncharacterised protein [Acetobacterium wieringae]|uniref:hypothetical protein n=1 Tax=Acetobacterium wieringae TaxID=52694 RepID=UPI001E0FAF5B|nr:hypothetical protein [Acetobacterium wieringae]VUZ26855.1 Uncharacterised protein [Acetobacterium wieringae]
METNITDDRYGIGEEKIEWLKSIAATEINEPWAYCANSGRRELPDEFFSVKYLKETPLGKLKESFNSHLIK